MSKNCFLELPLNQDIFGETFHIFSTRGITMAPSASGSGLAIFDRLDTSRLGVILSGSHHISPPDRQCHIKTHNRQKRRNECAYSESKPHINRTLYCSIRWAGRKSNSQTGKMRDSVWKTSERALVNRRFILAWLMSRDLAVWQDLQCLPLQH